MRYLIFLLLLASCYTPNKAIKDAEKSIRKHPASVLPIFRGAFPCIVTASDTIYQVHDTIIEIPCPEGSIFHHYKTDTIKGIIVQTKVVKIPVRVQLPGKVITKYIEDSSKIKSLSIVINDLNKDCDRLDGKVKRRNKIIWWLIIMLGFSILLNVAKYRK